MTNRLSHAAWCLALVCGIATQTPAAEPETAATPASSARMTPLVMNIKRAMASTVNIHTEKRNKMSDVAFSLTKSPSKVNGMGTGIIVDERGYILTNNHVIQDVESIRVVTDKGENYIATPFQTDAKSDLAIIKITPREQLTVIRVGTSSDLMIGEDVFAIGNSFGYENTTSKGIISALKRDVEAGEDQAYENLIQTDAAINPGNSGGPLINADGEVIGINVAIRAGAQKIGFAIPIDAARNVLARMISVERTSNVFHGVVTRDHKSGSLRELLVQAVKPNSPAASAGLQPGDVVLKVGVSSVVDSADFERALMDHKPTEKLTLVVNRAGKEESLAMQLARQESNTARQTVQVNLPVGAAPASSSSTAKNIWDNLGFKASPLPKSDPKLEGLAYEGGMIVSEVRADSLAHKNGIAVGDILVGLHGFQTVKEGDIQYVLKNLDYKTNPLKFYIVRDRDTLYGYFAENARTALRK
jgi:serine protease Do